MLYTLKSKYYSSLDTLQHNHFWNTGIPVSLFRQHKGSCRFGHDYLFHLYSIQQLYHLNKPHFDLCSNKIYKTHLLFHHRLQQKQYKWIKRDLLDKVYEGSSSCHLSLLCGKLVWEQVYCLHIFFWHILSQKRDSQKDLALQLWS